MEDPFGTLPDRHEGARAAKLPLPDLLGDGENFSQIADIARSSFWGCGPD